MKIHCDIIHDLLPSYIEGICSNATKDLVNNHLKDCSTCRELLNELNKEVIEKVNIDEVKQPLLKVKKNTLKKVIISFVIAPIICFSLFVGWCTFSGEGLSIDALIYRNKLNSFMQCLSLSDYENASKYLSFYGFDNSNKLRNEWSQKMSDLDIDFTTMNWTPLYADNGLVNSYVNVILETGETMEFRVLVQGNGLSISSIYVHNNDELTNVIQHVMTSHNPG